MEFPASVRNNPFFENMSDEQVNSLLSLAQDRNFEGGDTLVRQFDRNSDLMIVLMGRVCIKTFSGEQISELGPGGVFGEVSLVDEAPRSANVIAMGSGRMAVLPSRELHAALDADSELRAQVMKNVAKILCARLRAANIHLDAAVNR